MNRQGMAVARSAAGVLTGGSDGDSRAAVRQWGHWRHLFAVLLAVFLAGPSRAQTTRPSVKVVIAATVEDRQRMIEATVTADGKVVPNANVSFAVVRTFGNLIVGQDTTEDDGTAAVPFPLDLPGNDKGQIQVVATVTAPEAYKGTRARETLDGAKPFIPQADVFPRALWAPRAPILLIVCISVIVAGVWCIYGFVFYQLVAISRRR